MTVYSFLYLTKRRVAAPGWWLLAALLSTTALSGAEPGISVALQAKRSWHFAKGKVHFSNQFPGARLNGCEALNEREFRLTVAPENTPINQSPMYAFQVWADQHKTIRIFLTNTYAGILRRPWVSDDGKHWKRLPLADYQFSRQTNTACLRLKVGPHRRWVSAVEPLGVEALERWTESKARLPFAWTTVMGKSIAGHPLRALVLGETTNANFIYVLGRQHPPEVTGSMGLTSFVDAIAGRSALARRFRRQFQTVVVPLLNPDGVEEGHWRSNLGAVDLNRDWKAFSQPETVAARDVFNRFHQRPGATSYLFVDFHSTSTNVFYCETAAAAAVGDQFVDRWLAALHQRCHKFPFERDNSHNRGVPTAKAWAGAALRVPSVTCEFGYGTDPGLIRRAARIQAEEMMRLLLEAKARRGL